MVIKKLSYEELKNKKYSVIIKFDKYLDIIPNEMGFRLKWIDTEQYERVLEDEIFSDWLDNPVLYGAYENNEFIGFVEGFYEEWNSRFRITNIILFDSKNRAKGIGKLLLDAITDEAKKTKARMIVLETQSYNYNAIKFYLNNGFEIIGFDRYAYSNSDPSEHNMRIEMGKKIEKY